MVSFFLFFSFLFLTARLTNDRRLNQIERKIDRILVSIESQSTSHRPPIAHSTIKYIFDGSNFSIAQADRVLAQYKGTKMLQFPFVIIPCSVDASVISQEAPLLFLSIIASSIDDSLSTRDEFIPNIKEKLGQAINELVSQAIGQRSYQEDVVDFAFLQGLIVFLAWSHYQLPVASKQVYLLLQLALNCAADLGIDAFPSVPTETTTLQEEQVCNQNPLGQQRSRTAAEYRAFLGCFYLCSSMSMLRARVSLSPSEWVVHCCRSLELWNEHPSDASLKSLIEVRTLNARIFEVFPSASNICSTTLLDIFRQELCRIETESFFHVSETNRKSPLHRHFIAHEKYTNLVKMQSNWRFDFLPFYWT